MKRESRAYMHKDGFTFDSQGVVESGVIVNLRRDENKRFRNGNSRFIFLRRTLLPLSLESASNRTSTVPANTLLPTFEILQIF